MISGLHLLEIGVLIAIVLGILYWVLSASSRIEDKRREEQKLRRQFHQPWDPDVTGGRSKR